MRVHRSILVLAAVVAVALFAAACGDDDTTVTTSTQVNGENGNGGEPAPTVEPRTNVPDLDAIIAAALGGDDAGYIRLAGLTGYQLVACQSEASAEAPACREGDGDGDEVEALPVSDCGPQWVRPEQATDNYRISVPAGSSDFVAAYRPSGEASLYGTNFGATSVLVFTTGALEDGTAAGTSLHINEGRIVWVERSCPNLVALLSPERIDSFIVEPPPVVEDIVPDADTPPEAPIEDVPPEAPIDDLPPDDPATE